MTFPIDWLEVSRTMTPMTDDTLETTVDYLNIDWGSAFENAYPKPVIPDPKSMKVKADTEEDVDRLWQSVIDYNSG